MFYNLHEKDWPFVKLEDVAQVLGGYAFKSKEFSLEGNPIIKIKNVNGRIVDKNECDLYPAELCKNLSKFIISNDDILVAMTGAGSVGRVSKFIQYDNRTYYLNQRVGKIIVKESLLDNEYLFQLLSTKRYEKILFDLANGSGQPNLSPKTIGLLEIPLPPLNEQKAIADILSSLDDKIELNNQMNETLEEMAQTLFKRWFVDFEFPNEEGQPYKSSGGEMIESELGMIPKGWEVKRISDLIEVKDGTHASPKPVSQGYPLITSKHINGKSIKYNEANLISLEDYQEVNKRSKVNTGDILISMIGTVGLVHYVQEKEVNFAIKNLGLFKSSSNIDIQEYLYLYLTSQGMKNYIEARLAGTTQKYISLKELRDIPFIVPNQGLLLNFKKSVCTIFELKFEKIIENKALTNIRDTLLPKLMSGEIRVSDLC